jgi:hypothetical protein
MFKYFCRKNKSKQRHLKWILLFSICPNSTSQFNFAPNTLLEACLQPNHADAMSHFYPHYVVFTLTQVMYER